MSSWPTWTPSAPIAKRDVDAIVDHQRHAQRRQRRLDRARPLDHDAGVAHLVAQLDQRRAAFGQHAGEFGQVVAAGALRIDNRVEPQIHRRHVTLPRCRSVSWSRPYSASTISTARLPGPRARQAGLYFQMQLLQHML